MWQRLGMIVIGVTSAVWATSSAGQQKEEVSAATVRIEECRTVDGETTLRQCVADLIGIIETEQKLMQSERSTMSF